MRVSLRPGGAGGSFSSFDCAGLVKPQSFPTRRTCLLAGLTLAMGVPAGAVVVRGRVTDPLGKALGGARVQLVESGRVVSTAYAGPDGSYELRSGDAGRFTLLGSAGGYLPGIGQDFYGGTTDVVPMNVVLSTTTVQQQVSVTASGVPTPLQQLTAPVALIGPEDLATRVGLVSELRQSPGVVVVQSGQSGSVTSLFVRGGPSDGNKVLVDGVPAEDVGGGFDWGTVSSTGLARVELYRNPNSALYGSDSQAGVISLTTPRGDTLKPVLHYSGDAGTLHSYRNEVTAGGTLQKLDYFGGFSRFDTSNALPNDQYHNTTAVANLGYDLFKGASVRGTVRYGATAEGIPGPYGFYGLTVPAKEGDQDLYGNVTVEDRTQGDWHNLLRYGIARKREQAAYFGSVGNPVTFNFGTAASPYLYTEYFGNPTTIHGANGYAVTGQAEIFNSDNQQVSNRDELYYQSDYTFPKHVTALFGFRYENERGRFLDADYGEDQRLQRTNYEWNLQFQGDVASRVFYSVGGSLQKNHLYGYAGEPRFGLAWVPVRPGPGRFRGTKLRGNLATGVQEPSLATEFDSLYRELNVLGDSSDIRLYGVAPLGPERSRSADVGLDQSLYGQKLKVSVDYFHNQFSHQLEYVASGDLQTYFGFRIANPQLLANPYLAFYGAELNSLAYRAQGGELAVEWQAPKGFFVRGGYTYLDAVVSQSFAGDVTAAKQGVPTENPLFPGVPLGGTSPLVGARPFRRPPHTGFFDVAYTRGKLNVMLKGALASRADDSTYLNGLALDTSGGNTLLLPNRDLDWGWAKLDLGGTYRVRSAVSVFVQLENLLNDQHIAPIGYPALPLTARAGVKVRLGGD